MDQIFSLAIYGQRAKHEGPKSQGKKQGAITYGTDQENEVSKIFIISICLAGSGTILFMRNSFKFLKQVESKKSQFEIVFK